MNERIKELMLEAGYAAPHLAGRGILLAKLIVKECVKHITDQQDLVETNWQCKDGIHIVYNLKEHFGIEE